MRPAFFFTIWLSCFSSIGALAGDLPLPFFSTNDLTPYWSSENHAASPAMISSFKAVNQDGKVVTESDFSGHLSLVNFFFASCGASCPLMMHTVQDLKKHLGNDVKIYSISTSPEQDGVQRLKDYGTMEHFDWALLTGARTEIFRLGREVFKADGSRRAEAPDFIHTTNIYLLDGKRRIRGVYDSTQSGAMQTLMQDLVRLAKEKADLSNS